MSAPDDLNRNPEVLAATREVAALEQRATELVIRTPAEFEQSAEELKRVKAAQKTLEALRTGITAPLNAALKATNDFFRGPADRLARAERTIKSAIGTYTEEQARLQREEQRKAEEKARKDRERLEAQAAAAIAKGNDAKAEALQERAATTVAPTISREPPKVAGVTVREVVRFEVVDGAKVPREYLAIDEGKIGRVVRALGMETRIEGIRVYLERQVAAGSM